jgi:CHAT domain-containing protein/Tfp pilus assembly protein PilF
MSIHRLMPAVLAALILWPTVVLGQSPELMDAYNQFKEKYAQDRYDEALPFAEEALRLGGQEFGPTNSELAILLNNVAELLRIQGRYGEAEPLNKRALVILEESYGSEHSNVAMSLANLARLYTDLGRYAEAEPLYKRALEIREKLLGPNHPHVASNLNNLAVLYAEQGRNAEVEFLYKRVLGILQNSLGAGHPDVAVALNNLGAFYREQGRYAEAEPLFMQALAETEKVLGREHLNVAEILSSLAMLYGDQGRHGVAEQLNKRALSIREKVLPPEHPDLATSLNNLASVYNDLDRYAEAEPLLKRALAIREKALGSEHPDIAVSLHNLALLYLRRGRYAEAELHIKEALAVWEMAYGPRNPNLATSLNILAFLYDDQGKYSEAVRLYERVLSIRENNFEPGHPDLAMSHNNLASAYYYQSRYSEALEHIRLASTIYRGRAARVTEQLSDGGLREQQSVRFVYVKHVLITYDILLSNPEQRQLWTESFEAGQLARATGTAAAVAQMGARVAAGEDRLARLVREHQDTLSRWQALDSALIKAAGKPSDERNGEKEDRMRSEQATADTRLTELELILRDEFPQYIEIAKPHPASIIETQKLLGPGEALLAYLVSDSATYLWVVRPDEVGMRWIDIGAEDLANKVAELRRALDPTGLRGPEDIKPYNTELAHELYSLLFEPAEDFLNGVTHIMTVADGPLQSLPLSILITKKLDSDEPSFEDYRGAAWLAKNHSFTTLPSVSSLRALRLFERGNAAEGAFAGFGDPVLDGGTGGARGSTVDALFSQGPVATVDLVRKLSPLPETSDELREIANSLGVGKDSMHVRERATETLVKSLDLSTTRVIAFATHGLLSGEMEGVAEPALVLTPPVLGSELDDGLLTASEIAQLKLNAELVILSACNTAAADGTPGAEGLSGLAKAFLYAGSRALLVSHWPVFSMAATEITTGLLKEVAGHAEIGHAEALRRTMLALMETPDKPYYAHPLFWAPYVVVGEGGPNRN